LWLPFLKFHFAAGFFFVDDILA
jgi:hypothetical protein